MPMRCKRCNSLTYIYEALSKKLCDIGTSIANGIRLTNDDEIAPIYDCEIWNLLSLRIVTWYNCINIDISDLDWDKNEYHDYNLDADGF